MLIVDPIYMSKTVHTQLLYVPLECSYGEFCVLVDAVLTLQRVEIGKKKLINLKNIVNKKYLSLQLIWEQLFLNALAKTNQQQIE